MFYTKHMREKEGGRKKKGTKVRNNDSAKKLAPAVFPSSRCLFHDGGERKEKKRKGNSGQYKFSKRFFRKSSRIHARSSCPRERKKRERGIKCKSCVKERVPLQVTSCHPY